MPHNTIGWTHQAHEQMDCPDDGQIEATHCRHTINVDDLRKRAQDYIESFGAGNWGRDEDVWIDMLQPTAGAHDAMLMGRYIFAISPDAILALIDAVEHRDAHAPNTDARPPSLQCAATSGTGRNPQ